jgi:hypothetical protein
MRVRSQKVRKESGEREISQALLVFFNKIKLGFSFYMLPNGSATIMGQKKSKK